ncbi:uncharacterized protein [Parasteatoda tepidariorum]|uniref:uncharacterized protein n=1 Tax=Parasteatoda tepidariorum TaxID=114398 RepID=UPI0039BC54EC
MTAISTANTTDRKTEKYSALYTSYPNSTTSVSTFVLVAVCVNQCSLMDQLPPTGKLDPRLSRTTENQGVELCRLFVRDKESATQFLIDTGAEISVIPPQPKEKRSVAKLELFAANGTKIKTYGQKLLNLDLGLRRSFNWPFVIADVNKPIIGIDFLSHFHLLVDSKNRKLIDGITSLSSIGDPGYGAVSPTLNTVQNQYEAILKEFPDLLRPTLAYNKIKSHNIAHFIETKGAPVTARARRLSAEKLKAAKAEFDFMLQQGLCRPSKSSWASPLQT